jgi:predicted Fe-S protein YdhL (DUF1289 family)
MVDSPCINVCAMDPDSGLCAGCFRTLAEIGAWSSLDDARRLAILADVARRRQEYDPHEGQLRCDCDRDG